MDIETKKETIFESLYTQFILRDIFGKFVPGALVLLSIALVFYTPVEIYYFLSKAHVPTWIVISGVTWIVAFGLQTLGEIFGLIRQWPKNLTDFETRYRWRIKFLDVATPLERQWCERYIVIKEACGVGYVAMLFCTVILILYKLINFIMDEASLNFEYSFCKNIPSGQFLVITYALINLILALRLCHLKHLDRQYSLICTVLRMKRTGFNEEYTPEYQNHSNKIFVFLLSFIVILAFSYAFVDYLCFKR